MEQMILWSPDFGEDLFLAWDYDNAVRDRFNAFCSECGHPEWGGDVDPVEDFAALELLREDDDGTGLYVNGRGSQYIWLRPDGEGFYDAASRWMDSDPRVDDALEAIDGAESLTELCDALNAAGEDDEVWEEVERQIDLCDLPTFGGDEPESGTLEVWSWDARYLMVGEGVPFELVSRREWDEARGE